MQSLPSALPKAFSLELASKLTKAALALIGDQYARDLVMCAQFFTWIAGPGADDERAQADTMSWLSNALQLIEGCDD